MIPVNQFILGGSDPLLYPSEKMTNSIDEQIAFLQSQKQAINEAYRRNAIPNANNGVTQNQQVTQQPTTQGIWDAIDAEIAPLTQEQQNCKTIKGNYLRIVPFFIYLNFSMDKFIDVIVDGILSNFDFGFMFIVNVLTYIIIKVIDYFNGDNKVPTWQKRCVLVVSIAAMAGIYIAAGYDNAIMLVNSAILAPVFWSWVVSPILKKLGVGYKDIDNTIG
jgi:hypothetical protein